MIEILLLSIYRRAAVCRVQSCELQRMWKSPKPILCPWGMPNPAVSYDIRTYHIFQCQSFSGWHKVVPIGSGPVLSQCSVPLEWTDHFSLELSEHHSVWRFEPDLEGQMQWPSGGMVARRTCGCRWQGLNCSLEEGESGPSADCREDPWSQAGQGLFCLFCFVLSFCFFKI